MLHFVFDFSVLCCILSLKVEGKTQELSYIPRTGCAGEKSSGNEEEHVRAVETG